MSQAAQLILTHGTSDLQIILRDAQGRRWRAAPDKAIVRRFHRWLLEQQEVANLIDLPADLAPREAETSITDWSGGRFSLLTGNQASEAMPERDQQGRLQLLLPKIEPALNKWLSQHARPKALAAAESSPFALALQKAGVERTPLQSVLVLSTDRDTDEQEPVATYTFLKNWLLKQGTPEAAIQEEIYLRAGEKLESTESPIAPAIAQRIERALTNFYDRTQRPTLLLASMGGLPTVKPLLAEITLLLAGDKAQNLFKTEHGAMGLLPPTPADALRVRRQCLEQIQRGALLDAFAMAATFHQAAEARCWVEPLRQAARLINGNPVGEQVKLPALQTLIDHAETTNCLLAAIRVETALLDERWLDAINGTLTFLEAAFRDAVNTWAKDALAEYRVRDRYMLFKNEPPEFMTSRGRKGEAPALSEWDGWGGTKHLAYKANMVGEFALEAWGKLLNADAIQDMRQTIYRPDNARFKLADYRNINTHGIMSQAEIDNAVTRFMGANLWSQGVNTPASRPKPGKCFISRPLVSKVIQHFTGTGTEPLALYQNLLKELEQRLINPTNGKA